MLGRRPARPQRGRARPDAQAVGEDVAGARLEGRHRVLERAGPDRRPRGARLPPRRLRLHDLHRQLGPAARRDLRRRSTSTTSPSSRCCRGNRNFEGRINPDVRMNYLASPPLVVAYALAGHDGHRPRQRADRPGRGRRRRLPARHLAVGGRRSRETVEAAVQSDMFRTSYGEVFDGDERWNGLDVPDRRPLRVGRRLDLRAPAAVLRGHARRARPRSTDIEGARVLALLGDSVTTDHISPGRLDQEGPPAGALPASSTASSRATSTPTASRRGNHEVMVRGTFANIRLRNQLAPGTEGGVTRHLPDGEQMSIYDAAMQLRRGGRAAGRRSPARSTARAPRATGRRRARSLLGVRAVHRRELRAHPPLQPRRHGRPAAAVPGRRAAESLGLTGEEEFTITGLAEPLNDGELPTRGRRHGRRQGVRRAGAHRHAEGGGVLPPRRHPALRAAPAAGAPRRRATGRRGPAGAAATRRRAAVAARMRRRQEARRRPCRRPGPRPPRARRSRRSSLGSTVYMTTAGAAGSWRSARQISRPSSCTRLRSRTTTSGRVRRRSCHRPGPSCALPTRREARLRTEDRRKTRAHDRVVVDDQDADHNGKVRRPRNGRG